MKQLWIWWMIGAGCTSGDFVNDPRTVVDVNGDGYADLVGMDLVGGDQHVVIHYGAPDFFDGFGPTRDGFREPDVAFRMSGAHPVAMGDADADGFSDIVLPRQRSADTFGIAVLHGGEDGLSATRETVIEVPGASAYPSIQPFWVGDTSCDGYDDIGVNPVVFQGTDNSAWLVRFDASGLRDIVRLTGRAQGVGDVNDDGCSDLIVGELVYLGGADGPVATDIAAPEPGEPRERSVDINADGIADVRGLDGWYLGSASGGPTLSRGLENIWANPNIPMPVVDFDQDGRVDFVQWSTNNSDIPNASTAAWTLNVAFGRPARELTREQLRGEIRPVLVPDDVYNSSDGERISGAVQRYLGSTGDIDGDGYPDLLGDGRLTNFGFVARGGPRFRGEADVLIPTANTGWVGVFDNGR